MTTSMTQILINFGQIKRSEGKLKFEDHNYDTLIILFQQENASNSLASAVDEFTETYYRNESDILNAVFPELK